MATTTRSHGPSLLDLPVEVRLEIYSYLFSEAKVFLHSDNVAGVSCMVPANAILSHRGCSGQLLQTCRTIAAEAQPVLYAHTTFHVLMQAFALSFPRTLSDGHSAAPWMKHIIWALNCDLLKKFYDEDFNFGSNEMKNVETLELRCCVDTWRNSFTGAPCDREAFVKDRQEMMVYARKLAACMEDADRLPVTVMEDQQFLGKGEVRLRLERKRLR